MIATTSVLTDRKNIEGKLEVGDVIEIWKAGACIVRTAVKVIEYLPTSAAVDGTVALKFTPDVPHGLIDPGLTVQRAHRHCRAEDTLGR